MTSIALRRRLRRDHAPRGEEDPSLRRRRLDARSERLGCSCRGHPPWLGADLILTSTSDVYGNAGPVPEEDSRSRAVDDKRWSYAVSKLYDEHLGLALAEEQGLKVTILRLFNVYGPRNHLSWWGGPMVTFAEAVLDGETDGDPRGRAADAHVHVCQRHRRCVRARAGDTGFRGEIVNVGATETISMIEWRSASKRCSASPCHFAPRSCRTTLPGKYQDVRHRVPDITKAKALLGFEAQISLDDGLRRTLDWHKRARPRRRNPSGRAVGEIVATATGATRALPLLPRARRRLGRGRTLILASGDAVSLVVAYVITFADLGADRPAPRRVGAGMVPRRRHVAAVPIWLGHLHGVSPLRQRQPADLDRKLRRGAGSVSRDARRFAGVPDPLAGCEPPGWAGGSTARSRSSSSSRRRSCSS